MIKKEKEISRPFLKWAGGKAQLLDVFDDLLPQNLGQMETFTYIEPFLGGGAMLFHMLQRFPNIKKVFANDINTDLIHTYLAVQNDVEGLIKQLTKISTEFYERESEEERAKYYLLKRDEFNHSRISRLKKSAILIFLNKTCFNGLYRVNSKGFFNVPFGKYTKPDICNENLLRADSKLLQKVVFLNGDFELLRDYVDGPTFMYLDPPYRPLTTTSSFTAYAKNSFGDEDQIRLKNFVDEIAAGSLFMESNSDRNALDKMDIFFDMLYQDYNITRVPAKRFINSNASKRGQIAEILIRNYR